MFSPETIIHNQQKWTQQILLTYFHDYLYLLNKKGIERKEFGRGMERGQRRGEVIEYILLKMYKNRFLIKMWLER